MKTDGKRQAEGGDYSPERDSIFHRFFEKMADPALLLKDGTFTDCNAATLKLLAYPSKTDFLNQKPSDISPALQPDGQSSVEKAAAMIAIAVREGAHRFEWLHMRADGLTVPVEVMLTPITVEGKVIMHTLWRDITERVRADEELRRSETKLRTLYDSTSDAVILLNKKGFFDCNKSTLAIFGCATSEEFCSMPPADLSPTKQACGRDSIQLAHKYIETAMDKGSYLFEWIHKRADNGQNFQAEVLLSAMKLDNKPAFQSVVRDITKRKEADEEIRQLAFYDPLTKLPNRRLLNDRLSQTMATGMRSGCYGALMFVDLDNFKPLNDTHGHEVGDLLLLEVAVRLKSCVREVDTVARFGGDEFVIILSELNTDRAVAASLAEIVAEKIRRTLSCSYLLTIEPEGGGAAIVRHHCTASIGVALFIGHQARLDDVIQRADTAMYQAKKAGRNAIKFAPFMLEEVGTEKYVAANFVQLAWRASFKCGNALIDNQHRALFGIANKLLTSILSGLPTSEVAALIDILIRDVVQHFKDEEAIITAAGFPGAAEHAAIHCELVNSAVNLVGSFQAGTLALGDLFQFLACDVVARHMLGADREYFPYLDKQDYKSGS